MNMVEKQSTTQKIMLQGLWRSHNANFNITVAHYIIQTNNCQAALKYGVGEGNIHNWRADLNCLKNANKRKFPRNKGTSNEHHSRKTKLKDANFTGHRLKTQEIAREQNIPRMSFEVSVGWCVRLMHH
ncbi:hypothetical protein PR048_013331 [Dryococelus australis]|uniref:Brinker DNA-binding domain-containing protein n=1 Tax=Dryococelus australis TaxID=614101 RepID=A0ABQ9HRV7_9NEOP|nr:hypothetical protein PR048_013331 [Dryococelus australis]